MARWHVELEVHGPITQAMAETILEAFEPETGSVIAGEGSLSITLDAQADSIPKAAAIGIRRLEPHLPAGTIFEAVRIFTPEVLDREAAATTTIELVGITEVAALLGVSRQRTSQLAKARYFPTPLAYLASGPVWDKVALTHFLEAWDRSPRHKAGKPGRPQKGQSLNDTVEKFLGTANPDTLT